MYYRMELTYDGIIDIPDTKYITASSTGYNLPPGNSKKISDLNLTLKSLLPNDIKVKIIFDDIRLRSKLITYKTIKYTKNLFFHTILGFTQSHSSPSNDALRRYIQLIAGAFKS